MLCRERDGCRVLAVRGRLQGGGQVNEVPLEEVLAAG